jgi:mRNA-degrading endonuclease toxin of MazEF toxin-antitoxin module
LGLKLHGASGDPLAEEQARTSIFSRGKVLDQLRTVDKQRLVKRLGEIESATADAVIETLAELFAK